MTIEEKIKKILVDNYATTYDALRPDTHLVNELKLDSLDRVELVMELEKEFDITIPDEDIEQIETIRQIIVYVQQHTHPQRRIGILSEK